MVKLLNSKLVWYQLQFGNHDKYSTLYNPRGITQKGQNSKSPKGNLPNILSIWNYFK
jgi:hypothetical protein